MPECCWAPAYSSLLQSYVIYIPLTFLPIFLSLLEPSLWFSSENLTCSSFIYGVLNSPEYLTSSNHYLKVLMGLRLMHVVEINDVLILTTVLTCWLITSFFSHSDPKIWGGGIFANSLIISIKKIFLLYHLAINTSKRHHIYFLSPLFPEEFTAYFLRSTSCFVSSVPWFSRIYKVAEHTSDCTILVEDKHCWITLRQRKASLASHLQCPYIVLCVLSVILQSAM